LIILKYCPSIRQEKLTRIIELSTVGVSTEIRAEYQFQYG